MSKKQSSQKITALYARLSRDDENEDVSGSIKNQRAILEKYAKDNRLPNPRFFIDDGYSGVTFARPAFTEILELAEQGLIENLVVKDHSRLGRNRLVVGQLLEEEFERLGIRYIAIMDNIDTAKGLSDLVPMQDLFNEWHAKNTSEKVRRVTQSKGMAGIPLTTNPPFGYMKNPENKKEWIVDEPAAEVVKRIFDMCISGLGPAQIAKRLKADGVMTPTEYWSSIKRKCGYKPAILHNWCSRTVADILMKQEYCGDTVNFRYTTKSFKSKKRIEKSPDEWKIFPDTHPAIIDRDTLELVLENIQRVFLNVHFCEKEFARKQMQCYAEDKKKELSRIKREITKSKNRISEIDKLIQTAYESNVKGKITDERFEVLTRDYELEQHELKEKLPAMESYLENQTDQTASLETFIKKVKSVMEPTELTAELLNEFIDKIYVHESRWFEGKRAQIIDIHYKGVGVLKEISPEEMEEQFKEHYLNKRKNGIA